MPNKKNHAFGPSFLTDQCQADKKTVWTKVIDLGEKIVNVTDILQAAPVIEDYYNLNYNPKTSLKIVHRQKEATAKYPMATYFFSGFMLSQKNIEDECRIIDCGSVSGPENSYTADYITYYYRQTNRLTVSLKQTNREHERVSELTDLDRAEMDWDKADIKILLNDNKEIVKVTYQPKEMHLSRSEISIILKDIGFFEKFPKLAGAIKTHLVLPEVDDILRKSELAEEKNVPLSILSKCFRNPQAITEKEIAEIRRSLFYKSWAIRQNIVKALDRLEQTGKINKLEIARAIQQAEDRDIKEDFLVIERSIRKDEAFIIETLSDIHGLNIALADIDKIYVEYFDKGKNKQVYKATVILTTGRSYVVAFSVIRYIFKGYMLGEFTDENLRESIAGWEIQSKINSSNVCRLAAYRWYDDYRPRTADREVKFSRQPQVEVDRNKWIYNNLLVVAREFIAGTDLKDALNNNLSPGIKRKIITPAIKSYLSLWLSTKNKENKGWYLGDPKPANIIIYKQGNQIKAKIIDFDALHKNGSFQECLGALKQFYAQNFINKVLGMLKLPTPPVQ